MDQETRDRFDEVEARLDQIIEILNGDEDDDPDFEDDEDDDDDG